MKTLAVRFQNVSKSYGPTRALIDLSLDVGAGSIHAILGENGAGKSTLIKILTGVLAPDTGSVEVFGERLEHAGPGGSGRHGIATVFQELSLVPHLSVEDNLFLSEPRRGLFGLIDIGKQRREARPWLDLVGLTDVRPGTHVSELPLAQKQLLEIAKALARRPRILLLDEATASLPGKDVDRLFDILRHAQVGGLSVLYISHRMSEIERIADRCSVLRNGQHIETFATKSRSYADVCRMLAGRDVSQIFPPRRPAKHDAPVLLRVDNLSAVDLVRNVSFTLRVGEVVGLGGLEGQGQKELLLALYGAIRPSGGTVEFAGSRFQPGSPAQALSGDRSLMLLPDDRKTDGLLLSDSIEDNMLLCVKRKLGRWGVRNAAAEDRIVAAAVDQLAIKIASPKAPVSSLSGGNQQKVLLARLTLNNPSLYILMDPTRGIDVGTKQEIYSLIRSLADQGAAVLFLTTDLEELIGMCDRVLVFYGGTVCRELLGSAITDVGILEASLNLKNDAKTSEAAA
ncbi:MAG: sugar ABC transporter ATP-binding protein [Mesorhizobium sp.]|uniref:sugar ABC transporter ATP-binding protein n=1 Tax=Mesorhizobium sp. TaxID=1871066 RepID=UPI000FE5E561|nr:sugar ABC transporter ATP-binding protein [Mesorhizobium sp.]RWM88736.1 MAG: sugar ABC transporter ATP-binding protein [Mesorhizobium sp.]